MTDKPFVFIDVETTGLDPERDDLIQIAWRRFGSAPTSTEIRAWIEHGGRCEVIHLQPSPDGERSLDGPWFREHSPWHNDPDFRDRVITIPDAAQRIAAEVGDAVIVNQNPAFDVGFLRALFKRAGQTPPPGFARRQLDTQTAGYLICPGLRATVSIGLDKLCGELGIPNEGAHDASVDVRRAALVWAEALDVIDYLS
jgi:DNA polymerase III epsilon subunit-like protein